jgi:hypothetical protein
VLEIYFNVTKILLQKIRDNGGMVTSNNICSKYREKGVFNIIQTVTEVNQNLAKSRLFYGEKSGCQSHIHDLFS